MCPGISNQCKGACVEHSVVEGLTYWAILLAAGLVGAGIVRKMGQPEVLGQLGAGIALSALAFFGWGMMDEMRHNEVMAFIAELGAIILLFMVGLESNIATMAKVGVNSLLVAVVGATIPFALGAWVLSPLFFPEASMAGHLFVGAALVATSVGITALVLQGMGINNLRPGQIVLGAAVIDDVLGLLVLAVVEPIAGGETVSALFVMVLCVKAVAFLGASVFLGALFAGPISAFLARIHPGEEMKVGMAFVFALFFSFLAQSLVGLAPIVGAFAAGLVLDPVHFSSFEKPHLATRLRRALGVRFLTDEPEVESIIHRHEHSHVEDAIKKVSILMVPVFFVYTGLQIDFASFLEVSLYPVALIIAAIAVAGKVAAGIAARGNLTERLLVGVSMIPRGEVGLIFASVGLATGAIEGAMFSTILLVVVLTTFVAPPLIKVMSVRYNREQDELESLVRSSQKQAVHS